MDFRGASAGSLAVLSDELGSAVSGSSPAAVAIAEALFEVSASMRQEAALRRFLTDASVPTEAKTGLVGEVFGSKIDPAAAALLTSAVGLRWTHGTDLPDALERLSEIATIRSAGEDSDRLLDELFAVSQAVQHTAALRDALSDPSRSEADKAALIDDLLAAKALPATVTLVKQSLSGSYRTVSAALIEYQRVAGQVDSERVAVIRVAQPLAKSELDRLRTTLSQRYGAAVHANVVVDPALLGGVRVEIGDDVIDGTILTRLDDARRAIAG